MARGAAKEHSLGHLHDKLATVFIKVLERYCNQLELASQDDIEQEMIDQIASWEPSPAMLSAISKFLKDNEIMYDSEETDKLSSQQRRLDEMKKKRGGNVVSLDKLAHAN